MVEITSRILTNHKNNFDLFFDQSFSTNLLCPDFKLKKNESEINLDKEWGSRGEAGIKKPTGKFLKKIFSSYLS